MRNREGWRAAAKEAAYAYPRLHRELEELRSMSITPKLTGMPRGGGDSRSVENAALRELPGGDQVAHDAVEHALRMMDGFRTASKRRRIVELVYWKRTHTVFGAGVEVGVSEETAFRWNADFLLCVGSYMRSR